jgi:excinuclease UvrABC helicase subunit UvrB
MECNVLITIGKMISDLKHYDFDTDDPKFIADVFKDKPDVVSKFPKSVSDKIFKSLGYSDDEIKSIQDLSDIGIF